MTDENPFCLTCRGSGHSEAECLGLINARIMAYNGEILYNPRYIGDTGVDEFKDVYGKQIGCVRKTLRYCHAKGKIRNNRTFKADEGFNYLWDKSFGLSCIGMDLQQQKSELKRLFALYRMDVPQLGDFHE